MKTILIIIWSSVIIIQSGTAKSDDVIIQVSGIDVARGGNIIVMIFDQDGFPKDHQKALYTQVKGATQTGMAFTFSLELGEMAVKVLHDENKDGKVSKNWTGIYPKEGLGFTNDQQVSLLGPPKYQKSSVSKAQFKGGLTISIIYP